MTRFFMFTSFAPAVGVFRVFDEFVADSPPAFPDIRVALALPWLVLTRFCCRMFPLHFFHRFVQLLTLWPNHALRRR